MGGSTMLNTACYYLNPISYTVISQTFGYGERHQLHTQKPGTNRYGNWKPVGDGNC